MFWDLKIIPGPSDKYGASGLVRSGSPGEAGRNLGSEKGKPGCNCCQPSRGKVKNIILLVMLLNSNNLLSTIKGQGGSNFSWGKRCSCSYSLINSKPCLFSVSRIWLGGQWALEGLEEEEVYSTSCRKKTVEGGTSSQSGREGVQSAVWLVSGLAK